MKTILVSTVIATLVFGTLIWYLNLPIVSMSMETEACKFVILRDGTEVPCSEELLAGKHITDWVR